MSNEITLNTLNRSAHTHFTYFIPFYFSPNKRNNTTARNLFQTSLWLFKINQVKSQIGLGEIQKKSLLIEGKVKVKFTHRFPILLLEFSKMDEMKATYALISHYSGQIKVNQRSRSQFGLWWCRLENSGLSWNRLGQTRRSLSLDQRQSGLPSVFIWTCHDAHRSFEVPLSRKQRPRVITQLKP